MIYSDSYMTYVVPSDYSTKSQLNKADDLFKSLNLRVQINRATLAAVQNAQLQEALGNKLIGEKVAPTNAERVEDMFAIKDKILSDLVAFTGSNKTANEIYQWIEHGKTQKSFMAYFPKFKEENKSLVGVSLPIFKALWINFLRNKNIAEVPPLDEAPPVRAPARPRVISAAERFAAARESLPIRDVGPTAEEQLSELYGPTNAALRERARFMTTRDLEREAGFDRMARELGIPLETLHRKYRKTPEQIDIENKERELESLSYVGTHPAGRFAFAAPGRVLSEQIQVDREARELANIAATKTKFMESFKNKPLMPFNKAFIQLEELDEKYGLDNIPHKDIEQTQYLLTSLLRNGPLRNTVAPDDIYSMTTHELANTIRRIKTDIVNDPSLSKFLPQTGYRGWPGRYAEKKPKHVSFEVKEDILKSPLERSRDALESLNELDQINYGLNNTTDEEALNTARGFLREFIENNPYIKDQGLPPGLERATGAQILDLRDQAVRMIEAEIEALRESEAKEEPKGTEGDTIPSEDAAVLLDKMNEAVGGLEGIGKSRLDLARSLVKSYILNNPVVELRHVPANLNTLDAPTLAALYASIKERMEAKQTGAQTPPVQKIPSDEKIDTMIAKLDITKTIAQMPDEGYIKALSKTLGKTEADLKDMFRLDIESEGDDARNDLARSLQDLKKNQKNIVEEEEVEVLASDIPKSKAEIAAENKAKLTEIETQLIEDIQKKTLYTDEDLRKIIDYIAEAPASGLKANESDMALRKKWEAYAYYSIMRRTGEIPTGPYYDRAKQVIDERLQKKSNKKIQVHLDNAIRGFPAKGFGPAKPGKPGKPGSSAFSTSSLFESAASSAPSARPKFE
jgi:hypothetical protein